MSFTKLYVQEGTALSIAFKNYGIIVTLEEFCRLCIRHLEVFGLEESH